MIYESQRVTEPFSAEEPSSSSESLRAADAERVPRDFERAASSRDLDDDLEEKLETLRGSFDQRAAELGRRTNKVREALDVAERIREQPLAAVGVGMAAGAVAALMKPTLGRAVTGLLSAIVLQTGRQLAWRVAERAFYDLLYPAQLPDLDAAPQATERTGIINPLHREGL